MARCKRRWFILLLHLFSAFTFLVQISSGASSTYVEQFFESVEVCTQGAVGPFSKFAKKKIRLANFPNNTVVVKLTRWPDMWASFLNFRCKFQVTAPSKHGVMVVIQSMHLRTNPSTPGCRDYIQFEQADGMKTKQICGELNPHDPSNLPEDLLGPRFFHDPKGEIDVSFQTDERDHNHNHTKKPIALQMVFTAYSECTDTAIISNKVRQCSSVRSFSCIPSNLFCDGVINCGFSDNDNSFASDETDCGEASRKSEDSVDRSISIYVFAVTTISTLLIVFFVVLGICCCLRKFGKRNHLAPNPSHGSQFLEFHLDNTGPPVPAPRPIETTVSEKVAEDLPPAYDALFPITQSKKK